jgi:hypothetical protein
MRSPESTPPTIDKDLIRTLTPFPIDLVKIYPKSFSLNHGLFYGLIQTSKGNKLVVMGEKNSVLKDLFRGTCHHHASTIKVCDLSAENTECLMSLFPYTKPISLKKDPITIGTGDRLGLATPGHIRAIQKFQIRPVLAQQSVRENTQTGRACAEVVRDAAWAVFQENYQGGYGADGDHLKSLQEVKHALEAGVSMVTLDLSEKLNPDVVHYPKEVIDLKFREEVDEDDSKVILHLFLNKEFLLKGPHGECSIHFDIDEVKRNTLLFSKAIDFTEEVYQVILSRSGGKQKIDFEVSMDETPFPTSPENHFFFIILLSHRGVCIDGLAPRFIGEFQKAIDYRGNLNDFRNQFYQHVLIAQDREHYKISIHSGSDKFSAFPAMGELAGKGLHLKTAGTSWLEAIRLIARMDPSLYRDMHRFALSSFKEASKHYSVTTDLDRIPKLEDLSDQKLSTLLDQDDARQLLHITYGFLLKATSGDGKSLFKNRLYHVLNHYEEDYWSLIERHIEKHLNLLGLEKN